MFLDSLIPRFHGVISISLNYYPNTTNSDNNNIRVYKKLDGQMAILYSFRSEWFVGSVSSPDGREAVLENHPNDTLPPQQQQLSFAQLFWKLLKEKQFTLPPLLNSNDNTENNNNNTTTNDQLRHQYCYQFEILSPNMRNIIRYLEDDIVFMGGR